MTRRVLLTADAVGGIWQYALELATGLRGFGWEPVVALLGPPAGAGHRAVAASAGVRLIETGLPLDWLAADATAVAAAGAVLARLARAEGVDLIQLNQPAFAVGFDTGVPLVVAIHSCVATWWDAVHGGALPGELGWQAQLTACGLQRADAVVAPSAAFARAVDARYGVMPQVVHNGRSPSPAMLESQRDVALAAGRLWDPGKDIATLDRAAARVAVRIEAAGPLTGPHGATVAPVHLRPLGRLDDAALAERLAARPVFVSTARYEPFGLGVLEAALAGCALVLSDIATFRELWDEVATFVAPGDDAGFAAAIDAFIAAPASRSAAGEQARRHAARYGPAAMAAGVDAIYRRVLAAPARRAA